MNVLFVHEVDWLAKVVFDIHFLAEALSLLDHKVFAIDYEDTWRREGLFDLGRLRTRQLDDISRAFPGSSVCLRRPGFIKIPGISRLSASLTHYLEIKRTIEEKHIEAMVLYSVPTNGLQAVSLARRFNIPVVFRSIDVLNILVRYSLLRPITKALERRVYSLADAVLPNTPQYLKYILKMGVPQSKVRWLPFPVDTQLFRPSVDCSEVRQKWGLSQSDQVVVFIGTLFEFSGLDGFIRQFPQIVKEVPQAKLLIVGDGPQRSRLEQIITELSLGKQVTITGFQPYHTMPQYINLATVCINPFVVSDTTMDIFPAKIVQYIACGKATVATPLHGITSLLPGESHGVVYASTATDMASQVISLLSSAERRRSLGESGLNHVRSHYNHDEIARQLAQILKEEVEKKRYGTKSART